jgi:hypothetical protein
VGEASVGIIDAAELPLRGAAHEPQNRLVSGFSVEQRLQVDIRNRFTISEFTQCFQTSIITPCGAGNRARSRLSSRLDLLESRSAA